MIATTIQLHTFSNFENGLCSIIIPIIQILRSTLKKPNAMCANLPSCTYENKEILAIKLGYLTNSQLN
ncbi:hypothetical protein GCM10010913_46720 [Paenibacillus aceti]|uniref:Uncharacterized protein n=1 Tax=Paenibacillus aceti TaxID=1820010 RepID=A0ABQ1W8A7_9BACL|nr:hypothetical protein GCM10010913_46720 [Paenibacillus aceti]